MQQLLECKQELSLTHKSAYCVPGIVSHPGEEDVTSKGDHRASLSTLVRTRFFPLVWSSQQSSGSWWKRTSEIIDHLPTETPAAVFLGEACVKRNYGFLQRTDWAWKWLPQPYPLASANWSPSWHPDSKTCYLLTCFQILGPWKLWDKRYFCLQSFNFGIIYYVAIERIQRVKALSSHIVGAGE